MEATRFFEYVRNNFPYSQYAALAQLAIADIAFERDDWAQAANQYQEFVKGHPSHPKADYAAFRVGLAYFNDRPSELFLLPPGHEKDLSPVRQALEALNRFVTGFPKSEYIPKARALIADARELLARTSATSRSSTGNANSGGERPAVTWRSRIPSATCMGARCTGSPSGARRRPTETRRTWATSERCCSAWCRRRADPRRAEAEAMLKKIPADAPVTSPTDPKPALQTPSDPAARKPVPLQPPAEAPADQ